MKPALYRQATRSLGSSGLFFDQERHCFALFGYRTGMVERTVVVAVELIFGMVEHTVAVVELMLGIVDHMVTMEA